MWGIMPDSLNVWIRIFSMVARLTLRPALVSAHGFIPRHGKMKEPLTLPAVSQGKTYQNDFSTTMRCGAKKAPPCAFLLYGSWLPRLLCWTSAMVPGLWHCVSSISSSFFHLGFCHLHTDTSLSEGEVLSSPLSSTYSYQPWCQDILSHPLFCSPKSLSYLKVHL